MILYDTFIFESNSSDRLNLKSSIRVKLTNFDKLQTKNEYTQGGKEKNIYYIDNTKNIIVKSTSETENCTKRDCRLNWLEK